MSVFGATMTDTSAKAITTLAQHQASSDFIDAILKSYSIDSETAYLLAAQKELNVVLPAPNQLQIDIDDSQGLVWYQSMLPILRQFTEITEVVAPSKSGKPNKLHITLTLDRDLTPVERIALQAALGSDRKRELLSIIRVWNNDKTPTLFLEKKV